MKLLALSLSPFLALGTVPTIAMAQPSDSAQDAPTYGLTAQQKATLLDEKSEATADAVLDQALDGDAVADSQDGRVHGEFGAVVGTHGMRGVYGTAAIPLGDNAGATVSFENSRYGDPRHR